MQASETVLIGASGMLGRAWVQVLESQGVPFTALGRPELDLASSENWEKSISERASVVINCAAYCDVDGAESAEAAATAVNADGVGRLARRCRAIGARLLHYSTDYVFDGQGSRPYVESEPHCPISAYGRSKARGEELIAQSGVRGIVARTSWLYAPWGKNFVLTIRRLAFERPLLRVVSDQRGRPTQAMELARRSWALLQAGGEGVYHLCDSGECTWFEFAQAIVSLTGAPARVEPCSSAEYPQKARRPTYSVLDLGRADRVLGPAPHWRDSLEQVLKRVAASPTG